MTALDFIKDLIIATFSQIVALSAGLVVFGILLHLFSRFTFKSLENAFGRSGVYLFAWLGTPVHELGHALFCIIFFHRIVEVRFFEPDPATGTLGYVSHTWNKKNPWHLLGNFFIGVGPIALGCAVLLGLFYFLVPGSSGVWDSIVAGTSRIDSGSAFGDYFNVFSDSSLALSQHIFTFENLSHWRFWVFLYLAICVSSNIKLSWSDLKLVLSGFIFIALILLLVNLIAMLAGYGSDELIPFTASSLGTIYSLFILALFLAIIGFILTYSFSALYVKLRYGHLLSPF